MAKLHFFNEYFDSKKSIESLEVPELIEILKDYEEEEIKIKKQASSSSIFRKDDGEEVESRLPSKIDRAIEATNKLKNLKGIPLLTKFIDILKEIGMWEDSTPMLTLRKRYGPQVFDIYVRHDPEAPAFIRKGVDF